MMINRRGNQKKQYGAIWAIAVVVLLSVIALRIFSHEAAQPITAEQAKRSLLAEYPGNVVTMNLEAGKYVAELQTGRGLYQLDLDAFTGEIVSIQLLEAAPSPVVSPTPQPASPLTPGAAESPQPTPAPQRVVSETEAIDLALQEVAGELDDVDTGINESGAFYLVEINTSDGREAVVQIDAISGSIMSVTWEDQDDDNS